MIRRIIHDTVRHGRHRLGSSDTQEEIDLRQVRRRQRDLCRFGTGQDYRATTRGAGRDCRHEDRTRERIPTPRRVASRSGHGGHRVTRLTPGNIYRHVLNGAALVLGKALDAIVDADQRGPVRVR